MASNKEQVKKWHPLETLGYWMVVLDEYDRFDVLWRDWSGFGNDYENVKRGNAYRIKTDALKALSRVKKALKNHLYIPPKETNENKDL